MSQPKPSSAFFQNRACEYFPCHVGADPERFSCLFCYCPLYALGAACGGTFTVTGGRKDCSGCLRPHEPERYAEIVAGAALLCGQRCDPEEKKEK